MDAINQQRGGPRKWGKIAELFPGRTRKATEVHGMKLLMKVYGTTTTDVLDTIDVSLLIGKPSRKWTNEENELIHQILQNMDVVNGDCWEKHVDEFRDRTVPELQLRAKYLVEKMEMGIRVKDDNDEDFIGYGVSSDKTPVFVPWSKEEDEMLEKLTANLPEGSGRWEAVVKMFPDRTRRAVISHARRLWMKKNGDSSMAGFNDELDTSMLVDDTVVIATITEPLRSASAVVSSSSATKKRLSQKARNVQYNPTSRAGVFEVDSGLAELAGDSDSEDDKDLYKVKTLWSFLEVRT